ncbi:hypothetical protein [Bacillus sp. AK128]
MTDKKDLPDFDSLSDRMIAKPTEQPIFAIKTNLDPQSPEEENPYYSENITEKDRQKLDEYFGNS